MKTIELSREQIELLINSINLDLENEDHPIIGNEVKEQNNKLKVIIEKINLGVKNNGL